MVAGVVDTAGHRHIPTQLVRKATAQPADETYSVLGLDELLGALDPPQACRTLMRGRAGNQTSGHIPQWRLIRGGVLGRLESEGKYVVNRNTTEQRIFNSEKPSMSSWPMCRGVVGK